MYPSRALYAVVVTTVNKLCGMCERTLWVLIKLSFPMFGRVAFSLNFLYAASLIVYLLDSSTFKALALACIPPIFHTNRNVCFFFFFPSPVTVKMKLTTPQVSTTRLHRRTGKGNCYKKLFPGHQKTFNGKLFFANNHFAGQMRAWKLRRIRSSVEGEGEVYP